MYLPLHKGSEKKYLLRIPNKLCVYILSVPLIAFITCVILTLLKDFESANKTHCNVPNVIPSISSSIGSFEPQNTIWKTAIYLHAPLRFVMVYLRWKFYRKTIRPDLDFIVNLAVLLNVVENISLIGLTYWTSAGDYAHHEKCFKTFIGTSIFYMLFVCILLTKYRRRPMITSMERKSVVLKWRCCILNIIMFSLAAVFFLRHNQYCEPYVYTLFGLSEYIVVLTNIGFHSTTGLDLQADFIYITKTGFITELM